MVPRSAPKATLETYRFQDPPGGGAYRCVQRPVGATWAILGAILAPTDPNGVQKSHLFAKSQHKMQKNEVQEGIPKKHDF